ncbi:DUF664 domain-containing protein [Amycolatopsis sp. FDAARGOS 1241]|uniref:mycothiol transferase n=1 Tax=Amycolatopsis sp. FDAARGOS 1241 TaxID=2778070 RepID=UPI00194F4B6B|nr:DUF664 domain-containing protein [Amycolatopsis sp. FDAARGOS 1241]QRP43410.1 DUF664 domain-containing protein [Amycolatopsis sp. FDAARGOS 1241]
MITPGQYLHVATRALAGMAAIVEHLGDDLAGVGLDVPGANSAYAVLNHCLGATAYWAGEIVAGRPAHRDRDAEFAASGPVAALLARTRKIADQLKKDVARADPKTPVPAALEDLGDPLDAGGALRHLCAALVQHHGQLEILRDVLPAQARTVA